MLAGQAVMVNWSNVAPKNRPAYYEWHSREHMVGRVSIPGFQRGRRFIAVRASRDFLVLYEVDSLAVLVGRDYMAKADNPSPLTQRVTRFISDSARAHNGIDLYERVHRTVCNQEQRIAVSGRRDNPFGCDQAACTGAVLDHHRLRQVFR